MRIGEWNRLKKMTALRLLSVSGVPNLPDFGMCRFNQLKKEHGHATLNS